VRETARLMQARCGFGVVLISLRLPGNEALTRGGSLHAFPRSPSTVLVQSTRVAFAFFDTTLVSSFDIL
jgi:hypothetical protein